MHRSYNVIVVQSISLVYRCKRETYLGCTVIDLVVNIKYFKGVKTLKPEVPYSKKNNIFHISCLITSGVINV